MDGLVVLRTVAALVADIPRPPGRVHAVITQALLLIKVLSLAAGFRRAGLVLAVDHGFDERCGGERVAGVRRGREYVVIKVGGEHGAQVEFLCELLECVHFLVGVFRQVVCFQQRVLVLHVTLSCWKCNVRFSKMWCSFPKEHQNKF